MSTRLTQKGTPMVDSLSLKLISNSSTITDKVTKYLALELSHMGYNTISPALLNFLSALDCGINYGSEIARTLGVSRQMVAKTVKELCNDGFLEQVDGTGKQKEILFTLKGERLIADARELLAKLDALLFKSLGEHTVSQTIQQLDDIQSLIDSKLQT